MAFGLSQRLRRLEGKLRPDGIQYIIAAPPVCQTVEEWVEKYAPRRPDDQARDLSGAETRLSELQEIGSRVSISPDNLDAGV